MAVPLGAVTARDWPLRAEAIATMKGKDASRRERALEGLDFSDEAADDDVEREETEGVFVVRDGFAKFVPVQLGIAGEEHFEVLEGIQADTEVISGPFRVLRELKDGAAVRPDTEGRKGRRGDRGRSEVESADTTTVEGG